jgi:translation initiation factor 1
MGSKRKDRSVADSADRVNPFAAVLAHALGVDAPIGPGKSILLDQEVNVEGLSKNGVVEVHFEKKGRNGKMATLLDFGVPTPSDLPLLAKELKTSLGVGGSLEASVLLLQGDVREKAITWLKSKSYTPKKVGG